MSSVPGKPVKTLLSVQIVIAVCFLIGQLSPESPAAVLNRASSSLGQHPAGIPQAVKTPTPQASPSSSPNAQGAAEKVGVVANILSALFGGQRSRKEKILNKSGPQFPASFSMNNFSIEAFVKSEWPVVIEYELAVDATAVLTIEVEGAQPFTQQLKPTNVVYRQDSQIDNGPVSYGVPKEYNKASQLVFKLPSQFGEKPQIAKVSVKVSADNQQKQPHFRILAMGMGDDAVGSVTIDRLTFQQGSSQTYAYTFLALRDFEKWAADFMRVSLTPDGELMPTRVKTDLFKQRVDRGAQKSGQWNGKADNGRISTGVHKVQVRVWKSTSGRRGGDWVARISDQEVQVH